MITHEKLIDIIFDKIILTPFIGLEEKKSLRNSYYNLTSDFEKFKIIQQIRFNYCNHKFLEQNIYKDLSELNL